MITLLYLVENEKFLLGETSAGPAGADAAELWHLRAEALSRVACGPQAPSVLLFV